MNVRDSAAVRESDPAPARDVAALAGWPLIEKLVAFPTVSRDSNLALLDWVRDYLAGYGIASTYTYNDERTKANLWATLPARDGNAATGGIVLSGHTDVVPVDGQPWDGDPFRATVRGDRVFGRGVTDMKSFSATGLAFVPELLRRGHRVRGLGVATGRGQPHGLRRDGREDRIGLDHRLDGDRPPPSPADEADDGGVAVADEQLGGGVDGDP